MKKTIFLIFVFNLIIINFVSSQNRQASITHKYITKCAWDIVKHQYPYVENSEMQYRMNNPYNNFYGDYYSGTYDQTYFGRNGKIISGAWAEDIDDKVFGYNLIIPGLEQHGNVLATISHFWKPDAGGDNWKMNAPTLFLGEYENAYKKSLAIWEGEMPDDPNKGALILGPFRSEYMPYFVRVRYNNLADVFQHPENVWVTHSRWLQEENWTPTDNVTLIQLLWEYSAYPEWEAKHYVKNIVWECVGKICHLIEDMGTPAHAHGDPHGCDNYENYLEVHHSEWSPNLNEGFININSKQYPLRYAMYTTCQIADKFAGNKYGGPWMGVQETMSGNHNIENSYGNDNYYDEIHPIYQQIDNYPVLEYPPLPGTIDPTYISNTANFTLIYSMRSVAGFLWYVYSTFVFPVNTIPIVQGFSPNFGDWPIIKPTINGTIDRISCIASGSPTITYAWTLSDNAPAGILINGARSYTGQHNYVDVYWPANVTGVWTLRVVASNSWGNSEMNFCVPNHNIVDDITVTEPDKDCGIPNPLIMNQNPFTFPCRFKINKEYAGEQFFWSVYYYQDGENHQVKTGYAYGNTDINADFTVTNSNGPCLNRPAQMKVLAYLVSNPSVSLHKYFNFTLYGENDITCNGDLKSYTNTSGSYEWVQNLHLALAGSNCNSPGGFNTISVYKITYLINKNPDQDVIVYPDNSLGYHYLQQYTQPQQPWAGIENISTTLTKVFTYVYYIPTQNIWLPCEKEKATIVYRLQNHLPPVISGYSPVPPIIYGTYGWISVILSQGGTVPCTYYWRCENKPNNVTFPNAIPTTNSGYEWETSENHLAISYPSSEKDKKVGQWDIYCAVSNEFGSSYPIKIPAIGHSSNSGCPWLLVQDIDTVYQEDNNLLNRSQFQENLGQDITDRYVLSKTPGIINNTITFSIEETANDISYINKVKLYAIDHPAGTKLCVTENNQLAIFDSASVISTSHANLNGDDITNDIQFHIEPRVTPACDTLDHVYASYPSNSDYNAIITVLKVKPWQINSNKNLDGLINISLNNETITSNFARREINSITAIPVNSSARTHQINEINIDWYKGNEIRYIAIAKLDYTNFTTTEIPLSEAFSSFNTDELERLMNIDSLYSTVESNKSLILKFFSETLTRKSNKTIIRDYVIEVNGRIESNLNKNGKLNRLLLNNSENPSVIFKNKLNFNYPNPFNPLTKICYSIEKQGLVKLKIYDILGREINTLVNEIKNPGEYIVEFNGSNLSSGVYFYRLECNGFTDIKKMLLIK